MPKTNGIIETRNTLSFSGGYLSPFLGTTAPPILKKEEDRQAYKNWLRRQGLPDDEESLEMFCAKGRWMLSQ